MLQRVLSAIIFVLLSVGIYAQSGTIQGTVYDATTGEPIPFANVVIQENGNLVNGGMSDFDGKYVIKPIPAGKYTVLVSYVGFTKYQMNGVQINSGKITFQDFRLNPAAEMLEEVVIKEYKVPLISKDQTESGGTVTAEDIAKMPGRSAEAVAATVGGVYSQDGQVQSVRGAREEATVYYVDGVKVRGSSAVPKAALEQVSVITGGVPAQYGDATGGIISYTTKGPSSKTRGSAEVVTSQFLDPRNKTLGAFTISGPILRVKEEGTDRKRTVMGYLLSTEFNYTEHSWTTSNHYYRAKDEVVDSIAARPLVPTGLASGGVFTNGGFLKEDAFIKQKYMENTPGYSADVAAKLDIQPARNLSITFGGNLAYRNSISPEWLGSNGPNGYTNSLFNWTNNPQNIYTNWKVYGRVTQKFTSQTPDQEQQSASVIKNAFYKIQVNYSRTTSINQDENHKDDLFKYGYVGKFKTYKIKSYEMGVDENTGLMGWIHNGFRDTLFTFEGSDVNPYLSQYTQNYYDLYPDPDYYRNREIIQSGNAILNGQDPMSIYSLWNLPGVQASSYSDAQFDQFSVRASGSADIFSHEVSLGFEFEQRSDRAYSVAPNNLWVMGRQLINKHISELDYSNPHLTTVWTGTQDIFTDTIWYDRKYSAEDQSAFDMNFRRAQGMDVAGTEWIDIDNYDPSEFKIEYFSADELINNGSQIASFYGYDQAGNKLTSKPSFEDFFTATDDDGNYTRPQPAFEPIYMAGYIQDKFSFKDLIFNIGLRVDRFDANQMVLKDPYSLYETQKVGDLSGGLANSTPGNIGDDFVVYMDNIDNPQSIMGYRDGDTWYLADGTEVDDPTLLNTATGIAPLLVDNDADEISPSAFEDYKPQVTVMPRVSFSFPISEEALFFAHYDILSKRPTYNLRMNPIQYMYLTNLSSQRINNPNQKVEKTIDYELGFQQKLSSSSSLKLSAFYRENRDMQQVIRVTGAYPVDYMTYGNIDFGTVKGFTMTYDLRRTGNISLRASYTLQFASGTGSDPETSFQFVRNGLPNIRTLLPLNYDQRHNFTVVMDFRFGGNASGLPYDGPRWFGKDIFANTGLNVTSSFGSGTPYTARTISGNNIIGSINGSNKPWTTNIDMRLDRDIVIKTEKDDKKKEYYLNIYLDVSNVFNIKNIRNVYSGTGNANDDGYLTEPKNQQSINSALDVEAYTNFYTMSMDYPGNYGLPRTVSLGVMFSF